MTEDEAKELEELFNAARDLARKLTMGDDGLFKTTFQCIFWEGCHYAYGKKLKEFKKP